MGLWQAGALSLTLSDIRTILETIRADHSSVDDPATVVFSSADEMTINDLATMADDHPDNVFDRVSIARHSGETFYRGGRAYRVDAWTLADSWRCVAVSSPDTCVTPRPDTLTMTTRQLFDILPAANNPYVALIEVTYSPNGWRAGYGIRRDKQTACFYN